MKWLFPPVADLRTREPDAATDPLFPILLPLFILVILEPFTQLNNLTLYILLNKILLLLIQSKYPIFIPFL